MKFSIEAYLAYEAIETIHKAMKKAEYGSLVSAKDSVMISAAEDRVSFSAGSSDRWVESYVLAEKGYTPDEEGNFVVPLRYLLDFLYWSSESDVAVQSYDDNVVFSDDNGFVKLPAKSGNWFPSKPDVEESDMIEFDSEKIHPSMFNVIGSVGDRGDKIDGIAISKNPDGDYVCVGTDSYRMSISPIPEDAYKTDVLPEMVIPVSLCIVLVDLLYVSFSVGEAGEYCKASFGNNEMFFKRWGSYPKWGHILEKFNEEHFNEIEIPDTEKFSHIVQRAASVSNVSDSVVTLSLEGEDIENGVLCLSAESEDRTSEFKVACEIVKLASADSVSMDIRYLKNALAHMHMEPDSALCVKWGHPKEAVCIWQPKEPKHRQIIMPVFRDSSE